VNQCFDFTRARTSAALSARKDDRAERQTSCVHGAWCGEVPVRLQSARATIVALLLVTGCRHSEKPAAAQPPVVEVAPVLQRDVPIYREWVATLNGYLNADIQARVQGYLIAQNFKEGSFVHKNEVLFEIDPRPFRAALDQARAQLAASEANAARAARDVERDRPLAAARAIPRQQLETDIELERAAVAAVKAAAAQVRRPSSTWATRRSVPSSMASRASPRCRSATWCPPPACSPPYRRSSR
jgi:membrane fusion protein (multidrug efflux system)